ncbi:TetR/AcrR family transcriptional regulator [Litorihabitans aurantiacus]|uniref:TetR family transcriptional regulator n=1 Tax=Litorihabitans aurantiacus TaxID=1930061 RepID=A0AA38CUE2_9MICO|nr:TetR/AcrR family transcriptional regulator [Litorihabitans aurantiacus]GMA32739.1 TetR family transcriptional regulator [Litorihabitans aurantiacus]
MEDELHDDGAAVREPLDAVEAPEPRRPGRRRDAAKDAAIVAAAHQLLVERGFDAMTMDDVAERAGVGKATVYRRWTTKVHLAVEAMTTAIPALTLDAVPDTGSLRGDLMTIPALIHRAREDAATDLLGPARDHPEIADQLHQRLARDRVTVLRGLLERAQVRGEVAPDRDLDLIAVVGPAVIFYAKAFSGEVFSPELLERVIDGVVLPLALLRP